MPSIKETLFRHALHYLKVLRRTGDLYMQGGEILQQSLALFDQERSNIESGQTWAEKNLQGEPRAVELCKDFPSAAAELLELRQHPQDSIRWLETGITAAKLLGDR